MIKSRNLVINHLFIVGNIYNLAPAVLFIEIFYEIESIVSLRFSSNLAPMGCSVG